MARLRFDNQTGVLGATLTAGATSATLAAPWTAATVVGPDFVAIELEPPTAGVRSPNYEVVYATPVSGSATLTITARGQEGTTAVQHNVGSVWSHGATSVDFVPVVASVAGKTGAVTLVESDVGNLVTDLAAKVALATVTTKGDLIVATASAAVARLGVGTDGQVLTADSTQATGAKWATPNVPGFATPAIALGTAAAAGVATTVIRSDATIVAFDATVPVTQNFSDAAATGSAAVAARRDHVHGMPAAPSVTFPLTSAGDETFQPNGIATNALTLHNATSAVNGLTVTGSATTAPVLLTATGTDANLGMKLQTKGSGAVVVESPTASVGVNVFQVTMTGAGGATLMTVSTATGPVGNLSVGGDVSGATCTASGTVLGVGTSSSAIGIGVDGSSNLVLAVGNTHKQAYVRYLTAGPVAHTTTILDDGSSNFSVGNDLQNQVKINGSATGVAPAVSAVGGDANVSLNLTPKGSGNVVVTANGLQIPANQIIDTSTAGILALGFNNASQIKLIAAPTTGSVIIGTSANTAAGLAALTVQGAGSGVNGYTISQTATGVSPSIAATGSDVNLDVVLVTKGTGVVDFGYADQLTVGAAGTASALPAQPSKYVKIKSNGVLYVVPAYLAA